MVTMVPRYAELAALDDALARADSGAGRLVLVEGEAGSGKSTTTRMFADRAARDHDVLVGYCEPLSTPRPGGPLLDLAPRLGGGLSELLREGHREGLLDAALAAMTTGRRKVVIVEDVQWADALTLDLLRFVARRVDDHALLVVVTCRSGELGTDHPTRAWLGDLATNPAVVRLPVPSLTRDQVATLAGGTATDVDALLARTGGNAFFVTEALAAGETVLPGRVQDAVAARLGRLPEPARQALAAAAVLGARIEPQSLLAMPDVTATAVDACVSAGLLRFQPPAYEFRHEIVREAVVTSLGPATLQSLHAAALALLSTRADEPDVLHRLAEHADQSGDGAAVLRFAPVAGDRASALGAHREAAAQLGRAVAHADREPPEVRAHLLERLADELALTARSASALEPRTEALALRRDLNDVPAVIADLRALSRLYVDLARPADAAAAADDALALLEGGPRDAAYAMALSARAGLDMVMARYPTSMAYGEQALELATELGDMFTRVHALGSVGYARTASGRDDGIPLIEESIRLAVEHGLHDLAGRSYQNISCLGVDFGIPALAERHQRDGLAYCQAHELETSGVCLESDRLLYLLDAGRWQEVEDDIGALLARVDPSPMHRYVALVPAVRLLVRTGRPHQDLLDEADRIARTLADPPRRTQALTARAEASWFAGRLDEVRPDLEEAVAAAVDREDGWITAEAAVWLRRLDPAYRLPEIARGPWALAGRSREQAAAWRALDRPYDAALALLDGDESDLRGALVTLNDLGAVPAARIARQRLRDLGVTRIERGPRASTVANPYGLTGREMEVWGLLAEHLTNAEVAERLVLSERTVHHHVSSVLAKLGVRSRGEAAALVPPSVRSAAGHDAGPTWASAADPGSATGS